MVYSNYTGIPNFSTSHLFCVLLDLTHTTSIFNRNFPELICDSHIQQIMLRFLSDKLIY